MKRIDKNSPTRDISGRAERKKDEKFGNFRHLLANGHRRQRELGEDAPGSYSGLNPGGVEVAQTVISQCLGGRSVPGTGSAGSAGLSLDTTEPLKSMRVRVFDGVTKLELELVIDSRRYRVDLSKEASAIQASFVANSASDRRKLRDWLPVLSSGFERRGLVVDLRTEVAPQRGSSRAGRNAKRHSEYGQKRD
jgi:hypothetical protein